jgi:hypothetical protein
MQKHRKYEKTKQHTTSKLNNATITSTNDSKKDEISDKEFQKKDYMKGQ